MEDFSYTEEMIGWSLDIFGKYADPISKKQKIFDFSKSVKKNARIGNKEFTYPEYKYFSFYPNNTTYGMIREGNTLNEYGSSFQEKLSIGGKFGLFSSEVNIMFQEDEYHRRTTRFSFYDLILELGVFALQIPALSYWYKSEEAKKLISPTFRKHLMEMSPDRLFRDYGTHWITKLIFGGRCYQGYSSENTTDVSRYQLAIDAKASFDALIFSANGNSSTYWQQFLNKKYKETSFHYEAKGGKSEQIKTSPVNWLSSVRDDPAVISYGGSNSSALCGIWEFLEYDDPRRKQLYNEYENLLKKHKTPLPIEPVEPVLIYEYPNYSSHKFELKIGEYKDLARVERNWSWRNQIDSIIIPDGVVVTAWSNTGFSGRKYGPYRGPIKIPQVYGINDWDSMKVEYSADVEPFVEIFAYPDWDYSKKCASVFEGDYPDLSSLNREGWQNEVDSIIIPKGLKVTAWSHSNFKNKKYGPFTHSMHKVHGQNDWDSMKVEKVL